MENKISLKNQKKKIYPALPQFDAAKDTEHLQFTNYYLQRNQQPFFAIAGEFHFSRYSASKWEDELIKMKMSGINVVTTYVFWNHHEEVQGHFDWQDSKNLGLFIDLCQKHQLYSIVRVGPFCHGEVRNGGLPDWLYGAPFELRSNHPEYLKLVKRWYQEISYQLTGKMFSDGGTVIGVQLENEYGHSSAPWELTTGTTNEWVDSGHEGDFHIGKLKKIAAAAGLKTFMYTATAWGGANSPAANTLPLWGGYAFRPWIFNDPSVTSHPATDEYIYRDYHNNEKRYSNFEPDYLPESLPFACCEMGGGMTVFYAYRFSLPFESVAAMTNVKVAGGCNFLGYYMYHGGTNPTGKTVPFLNEHNTPKFSYDFQAPLGEFGQTRLSYHLLKRMHLFFISEAENLAPMQTILPENSETIIPEDVDHLRYAVRVKGNSGYIFLNNYQDHLQTKSKKAESIELELQGEKLRVPAAGTFFLAADCSAILPFNYSLGSAKLSYATAQLVTKISQGSIATYIFFEPEGMQAELCLKKENILEINSRKVIVTESGDHYLTCGLGLIEIRTDDHEKIRLLILSEAESREIWQFQFQGQDHIWLTSANVLPGKETIKFETTSSQITISDLLGNSGFLLQKGFYLEKDKYKKQVHLPDYKYELKAINDQRFILDLTENDFSSSKEVLLQISYSGDVGYAFLKQKMIHDNFNNQQKWEIGLKDFAEDLSYAPLILSVTPDSKLRKVTSDSPMAARSETVSAHGKAISEISLVAVMEVLLDFKK